MSIFIGTSGYSYPHWIDNFYPKDLPQSKWLEHYSKFFNTVELNVTFYRLPQESAFKNWYKRTPKDFLFVVKGSRFITHIKKLKGVEDSVKLFIKDRAEILKEKLGLILWQLPPNFKVAESCKQSGIRLEEFERFLKLLTPYRLSHIAQFAFEFRNETWFNKEIYDLLKNYNCALVIADSPQLRSLSFAGQAQYPLTADFVYIRFHGGKILYGSEYSEKELKEWAYKIKKWSRGKDVFVYFNNDFQGFAVKNALKLKKFLKA